MALLGPADLVFLLALLLYLSARKGVWPVVGRPISWLFVGWLLLELGLSIDGIVAGTRTLIGVIL